jgi:c-di-GMP-binding flagellar brake protein YcgR
MDSSSDWKFQERRRFPRASYPCKVVVDYSLKPMFVHTENLSEGGMRVILPEQIPEKVVVDAELIFEKKKTIQCNAKVMWVRSKLASVDSVDLVYDTGFQFVSLSEDDQRYLDGVVKRLIGGL